MKLFTNKQKHQNPVSLREALIECLRPQSDRGKEYVYKRYYGYIMSITLRYMKHEMEAEEVTNEAFVKCFTNLQGFTKHEEDEVLEKQFKSWLARIAVNTSIDVIRAQKKNSMLDDVSESDLKVHAIANEQNLDYSDILQLLNHLPEVQKTIFNLFEIEGYSHYEIGERLDIPEGTSRTYLTRAKQRLRKLYKHYFNDSIES